MRFESGSVRPELMCGKSMLWVRIVVNGRPVRVVTTHLESMHDTREACTYRMQQFGEVLALMAGSDEAVICCGDFNLGFNKFNGPQYVALTRRRCVLHIHSPPDAPPVPPRPPRSVGHDAVEPRDEAHAVGFSRLQNVFGSLPHASVPCPLASCLPPCSMLVGRPTTPSSSPGPPPCAGCAGA